MQITVHQGIIETEPSDLAELKTEIIAKEGSWLNFVRHNIQKDGVMHIHTQSFGGLQKWLP